MTGLILFMAMDEKYNKVHIINSITDFLIPVGETDDNIEGQAVGFRGEFIGEQLPTMVQVTDAAFNNIKVKATYLITINQAMEAGVIDN